MVVSKLKLRILAIAMFIILPGYYANSFAISKALHTITDMAGRKVQVPDKINTIYVNNHCAILVYAIDPKIAVNRVKLSGDYPAKYFPKEYLKKPYTDGSAEEIIKLHPDVIVSSDEINSESIERANKLEEKTKIPFVILDLNILKYKEAIAFLGDLIAQPVKARELVDFVKTYIDQIEQKAKQIPAKDKVGVYYAEGINGLSTEPSGSKHSQIIDFVGAKNVAKVGVAPGTGLSEASMEQLLLWQPQIILVWTVNADKLQTYKNILTDPLWKNVNAVKNKKVYQIPWQPFGWFDRPPGVNRILGIIWTANLLYPATFNFDMVKVTQEYFKKFYHYNLSVDEAEILLSPDHKI